MSVNVHNIEENNIKKEKGLNAPLFSYGFRPFFLLAALQAISSIFVWVYSLYIGTTLIKWDNPALWHGHEMVYGFAVAVIAGFLLTAVPKWTGTKHLHGLPVVALTLLWLLGRFSMYGEIISPSIGPILDIIFIPALMLALSMPIIKAGKIKNIAFLGLLLALTLCNITIHAEQIGGYEYGRNALIIALFIVLQMVVVVGGRVMPMFTRNALIHLGIHVKTTIQPQIDLLAIVSLPILLVCGLTVGFDHFFIKLLAAFCALIHLVRLSAWHGIKAYKIPIVWVLHIGYLWIVISLLLLAITDLNTALHGFTMGAMGTMILAMTTRVALGHTGRIIHATKITVCSYVLLQCAIITRLIAPVTGYYQELLGVSGVLWVATFVCFLITYTPILLRRDP